MGMVDPNQPVSVSDGDGAVDLGEGATGFKAISKNHPLERTVVVTIRASLAELSTSQQKAAWSPDPAKLESIYKQKQFVDLQGNESSNGNLKSVVIHKIDAEAIKSTFPLTIGAKITGVEERTFSSVGVPYSAIVLPDTNTTMPHRLQEENVDLAYDFANRYPGYTAENLETNGIHAVPQRRFVLVAATHPLVTAIHENAGALQTADITQMPEQLVKISSNLYDTLMPLVKQQVESQIRVADLSKMAISIAPADHANWSTAADEMVREATAPLKAEMRRAIKRAGDDQTLLAKINDDYSNKIERKQADVTNVPLEFHVALKTTYNFL